MRRRVGTPFLVLVLVVSLLGTGPGAGALLAQDAPPESRSFMETAIRGGLAFAATTAIKGLFGMAPGYLGALIPSFGPAFAVPLLVGAGLVEGLISLTVFSAIMGTQDRRWLVRSYLAASVLSVLTTFMLGGVFSPLVVTVISNVARLVLFALLTRPPGTSLTKHLVSEVSMGAVDPTSTPSAPGTSLSVAELEEARRQAYRECVGASAEDVRAAAYDRFARLTVQLSAQRDVTAAR